MSEQIREQVSAFLDGELPDSESELLLKRLTRDGELRESFGRYSLIGEALRGTVTDRVTKGFAAGVNLAIDGEVQVAAPAREARATNWWRPLAGVGVAAGVATVAIVALQQRAITPSVPAAAPVVARNMAAAPNPAAQNVVAQNTSGHEPISYTVPATTVSATAAETPVAPARARLTDYVFAHSQYSTGLGQRGVLADLLIEDDEPAPAAHGPAAQPNPDARVAP
ncbi:MAG: sigma-E factor negative regulatory protein [Steroidobacteraceae bacterium]